MTEEQMIAFQLGFLRDKANRLVEEVKRLRRTDFLQYYPHIDALDQARRELEAALERKP